MKQIKTLLLLLLITASGASAQSIAAFSYSQTSVCAGDTFIITNLSTTDTGEYLIWDFDSTHVTVLSGNDTTPFVIVGLYPDSTIITLSIYDSTNTFVTGTSATIYIHPLPTIAVVTPTNGMITCSNPSIPIVIDADTLSTISWYINGINTGTTGLAFSAVMSDTGHFHLVATSIFGCVSNNAYEYSIVDGTALPTMALGICGQALGGDTSVSCFATDICASVNDPYPPTNYVWSTGATTATFTALTSGLYTLTVTNANGCIVTDTMQIFIGLPAPTFASVDTLCTGETISLSAPSGYSYLWTNGQVTQSIIVGVPGNYAVEISNGICSATSNTAVIDFHGLPETNLIVEPCLIKLASFEPGATFQWYDQMSNPIIGANGPSHNVTAPGYFSVQVTSAFGCVSTSSSLPVQCVVISSTGDALLLQSEIIEPYTAQVIDMQGRILREQFCSGNIIIDTQDLIPGIYIVRIIYADHRSIIQKVEKF